MKIYCRDFNNILLNLKKRFDLTEDAREADCLVLWQDVRGDMAELCKINQEYLHKPVVVVQHGRGATNDYLPPNKFPLQATKFCCWGIKDYERLERAGYADRAVITGSPLIDFLSPRINHDGKNITFCPVITQHEEPENIIAYWTLKRIELKKSIETLEKHKDKLKDAWHAYKIQENTATEDTIPYYNINADWRLIAKITDVHDKKLYFGDVVSTMPSNRAHLSDIIKLLSVTDCVVGIEEGTFPLLAMAMEIPVVIVDGFKYKIYGDIDYSSVEMIKTNAVRRVELSELEKTIDDELTNPATLKKEREQIVRDELWDGITNPNDNIEKVIREIING